MQMKQRRYIKALGVLLALSACSTDNSQVEKGQAALQINTSMAGVTRTTQYSGLQENELSTSVTAAVYVYREGETTVTNGYGYENIPYTYNTTAAKWTHRTVFFPENWDDADVFVYAPRADAATGVTTIPVKVQEDQSTTAGYLASDFVFGRANVDYAYPTATTSVTLYHALSKLILNFQDLNGETSTLGSLQKVELGTETYAVRLNALVNITTPIAAASEVASKNAVTTLADYGIITLLDVSKETTSTPWSMACILPPQKLPEEGTNLTLTFSTGKTYTGILEATLVAGCTHTYTVTINQEALTFSGVIIHPWGNGWGNDPAPSQILQ